MTIIAQVEDRGAVVAWSPIPGQADLIAIGAKDSGGIGFDDYGGELELYKLNISSTDGSSKPEVQGKISTPARFASIGWTPANFQSGNYEMGLLAGGLVDGSLHVWDPNLITSQGTSPSLISFSQHFKGAVTALAFNPHPECAYELATGGSNGEVTITNIENPEQPVSFSLNVNQNGSEITKIAWNTQVPHIVAASSADGSITIYDTKQKKEWCEIRAESNGMPVTDIAWNPTEGLHIITASGDDRNPVLKLWDLRGSTSIPLATLQGHNQGILSIAWCPHDAGLLLSCGKDNRTLLWDLYSLKAIYELPAGGDASMKSATPESMYAGSLSTSQQKRYEVLWSPIMRGVISTCSFDRKVQAHSVIGAATKSGRTPKWMKRPSGVSCGFGGTIVSFREHHRGIQVDEYTEEPSLKMASNYFEQAISTGEYIGFCEMKSAQAKDVGNQYESTMWGFMGIIFEENAREKILDFLGFDPETISEKAMRFKNSDSGVESLSLQDGVPPMSNRAVETVKQALLVGNFEAAVECCIQSGNLADALLLSSCGGAELWAKTQSRYFELESQKRSFLPIVSAVIHDELLDLVASSDPSKWQETLAILSTYGKSEEFPSLCLALGDRLNEFGDRESASLCFMCALNLERVAEYWRYQLEQANEGSDSPDLLALQAFIEKVTIFLQATDPQTPLDSDVANIFGEYASYLASQGSLTVAAKYCRSDTQSCNELQDRLYRSKDGHAVAQIFGSSPAFPFNKSNVGVAVVKPAATTQHVANGNYQNNQQSYNQQSYNNQPTSTYEQSNGYQTSQEQELPHGWIALQDPGSGNTYYANQETGETTWEKPAPPAVASQHQNSYQNQQNAFDQPQNHGYDNSNVMHTSETPSKLATKYGDGFVTSASHPELGEQYGNITTSNPYAGAVRPGTAAITPSRVDENETFEQKEPQPLSEEAKFISDVLMSTNALLSTCIQTPNEKRQFDEITKATDILTTRLSRNEIDPSIASKMNYFVQAIQNKDYSTAASIQTGLVNNDWRRHKDWLKGMKFLCQLSARKL